MSARWEVVADDERERYRLPASAARVLRGLIEPGWMADAECLSIDPELWFPEKGGATSRAVFEICASCPVRTSCLATGLVDVEEGIWGGVQTYPRGQARGQIGRGADPLVVLDQLLERAAETRSERRSAA
jgi:WhiB family redox-sensing transcriptional regulator